MQSTRLLPTDPSYPSALFDLVPARSKRRAAPPTLYLRGTLPASPGIAIVGTRVASEEALRFAWALACALGEEGFAIWSGGARGVDAAAHEGALAAGAPTVVVAGGGHDTPYPREHAPLFERVLAEGGALVSRVPDDAPPMPPYFVQRNEIIAAMTAATVVVEAGIESGARSTAAAARRLGRPLLVVPHAPWDPRGAGCLLELGRGARLATSAADIVAVVGAPRTASAAPRLASPPELRRAPRAAPRAHPHGPHEGSRERGLPTHVEGIERAALTLDQDERVVLDALRAGPAHVDEVCERTGLSPRAAARALLTLTLHAVVVEGPAGSYRRAHYI